MPIELPQLDGSLRPSSGSRSQDLSWSEADELAALETVWDSLCQDAATARPPVQLPVLPAPRQVRAAVLASSRRRVRRAGRVGRRAS